MPPPARAVEANPGGETRPPVTLAQARARAEAKST